MSKLLYIKASPRQERSHSLAVADAFVASYKQSHPGDEIVTLDLFNKELPAFDGFALQAKYAILHGRDPSEDEKAAWRAVEELIEEFKSADKYVFATPMWNFSLPYKLKHYIDVIVQPGYTFSYSPDSGYTGLITGKPVFISYARGGEYPAGTQGEGLDLQSKYLNLVLGFIGFTDIRTLFVEPTLMGGPEVAQGKRTAAAAEAAEMAKDF
jgi:FMN-dependent NADH-azoreductase